MTKCPLSTTTGRIWREHARNMRDETTAKPCETSEGATNNKSRVYTAESARISIRHEESRAIPGVDSSPCLGRNRRKESTAGSYSRVFLDSDALPSESSWGGIDGRNPR